MKNKTIGQTESILPHKGIESTQSAQHGTLLLVRHGQSLYNQQNRFTGWQDPDLSAQGIAEAVSLGHKLSGWKPDIAFTSTLIRAAHTLTILLKTLGGPNIPIIKSQDLNERCYGALEGLNKEETTMKYGIEKVQRWRRSYTVRPPGGESLKDTAARVIPYFEKMIKPELIVGKNVLVVAHGNSLRALAMHLEKLSEKAVVALEIPTCVPLKYDFGPAIAVHRTAFP
jgi:2,3-bisphosphoglycerate-dependent phosphoglycerate mutase